MRRAATAVLGVALVATPGCGQINDNPPPQKEPHDGVTAPEPPEREPAGPMAAAPYAPWPKAERNAERYVKNMLADQGVRDAVVGCSRTDRRKFRCRGRASYGGRSCAGKARVRVNRKAQVRYAVIYEVRC